MHVGARTVHCSPRRLTRSLVTWFEVAQRGGTSSPSGRRRSYTISELNLSEAIGPALVLLIVLNAQPIQCSLATAGICFCAYIE